MRSQATLNFLVTPTIGLLLSAAFTILFTVHGCTRGSSDDGYTAGSSMTNSSTTVAATAAANAPASPTDTTHAGTGTNTETATPAPAGDSNLSPLSQNKVLAQIGNTRITLGDFEKNLRNQAPYTQLKLNSSQRRKEYLDEMVQFEVLASEAARRGLAQDPDVIQATKQAMVRKLMANAMENTIKPDQITEEELRQYYQTNPGEYSKPEQVRASHIALRTREEALKVRSQIQKKINADKSSYRRIFSDFARQHSQDGQTKMRGGDLRYFAKDDDQTGPGVNVAPALREAAFSLKTPGTISQPVNSGEFWHIMMLTGRKKAVERSFDQVRAQIQNRLYRDMKQNAANTYIENLKAQAGVKVHHELLAELDNAALTDRQGSAGDTANPAGSGHEPEDAANTLNRLNKFLDKPEGIIPIKRN